MRVCNTLSYSFSRKSEWISLNGIMSHYDVMALNDLLIFLDGYSYN